MNVAPCGRMKAHREATRLCNGLRAGGTNVKCGDEFGCPARRVYVWGFYSPVEGDSSSAALVRIVCRLEALKMKTFSQCRERARWV
jgi:hypothetical protein